MTTYFPPKKNTAFVLYISVVSQANTKIMQSSPTIAAGDFKVSIDGGALNNLATLPVVTPAASKMIKVDLSASEMNGDNITVVCSDAAGAEWCDLVINLQTTARQIDDLAYPTTSGRSIDVATTGEVGLDFDNIKDATGAHTLTNITVPLVTTATNLTTNNDKTGYSLTTLESTVLHSGTAQAGAAGSITLAAGASATDSLYVGEVVKIYGGTGAGQVRVITAYNGTTKVATVGRNWATNPDNTSLYAVLALAVPKVNDSLEVTAASVSGNVVGSVGSVVGAVTVGTNNDKTGYALTAGEHTNIATDTQTGLTAQGYTVARAGFLDTLNGLVAAIWASVTRTITGGTITTNSDKTGYSLSGAGVAAVQSGLSTVTSAQVLTQVQTALSVDTYAEPVGAPAATSSLKDKIGWLFKLARNKRATTAAADSVYNDAGNVVDSSSALSDDGVTFSRGKYT